MLNSREVLSRRRPRIRRIEVCVGARRGSLRPWQVEVRVWNPTACDAFWRVGMFRQEILMARKNPGS